MGERDGPLDGERKPSTAADLTADSRCNNIFCDKSHLTDKMDGVLGAGGKARTPSPFRDSDARQRAGRHGQMGDASLILFPFIFSLFQLSRIVA